jgi:hypothetical protein
MVGPAAVCETETVYVPVPPVPDPRAVMVVPAITLVPESVMPTSSVPDATAVTVSVVAAIEPVTTGAVTAVMVVPGATAGLWTALTVHVHGTFAPVHEPPTMETILVPAITFVPERVIPTSSVPDATAVTVSVVELTRMPPVTVAVGKVGATPRLAGQK